LKGKEEFFSPLRKEYSEIFNFILNRCSEVYLFEKKILNRYIYYWVFSSERKYLKSQIPLGYRVNNVIISEEGFYKAIPDCLKPFYYVMDGFDIDTNAKTTIEEYGFLRALNNWPSIDRVFGGVKNKKSIVSYIKENYPESDFRVICYGLEDDALVVDVENKYPGLFQVKINPVSFKLLDNPSKYITDIFFSNFPEAQRG